MITRFLKELYHHLPEEQVVLLERIVNNLALSLGDEAISCIEMGLQHYTIDEEIHTVVDLFRTTLLDYQKETLMKYGFRFNEEISIQHLNILNALHETMIELEYPQDVERLVAIVEEAEDDIEMFNDITDWLIAPMFCFDYRECLASVSPDLIQRLYEKLKTLLQEQEEDYSLYQDLSDEELSKRKYYIQKMYKKGWLNSVPAYILKPTLANPFNLSIQSLVRLYGSRIVSIEKNRHVSWLYLVVIGQGVLDWDKWSMEDLVKKVGELLHAFYDDEKDFIDDQLNALNLAKALVNKEEDLSD